MDRLEEMLKMQRKLQLRINGYDVDDQLLETCVQNVTLNVTALIAELYEMLNEISWKSWTTGPPFINQRAAQRELVDAWHFLMNLMLHLGMTSEDLWTIYRKKNAENFRRQDEGYDGVIGKCPQCKRDLNEVDVKEVVKNRFGASGTFLVDLYCICGHHLGSRPV